MSCSSTSPTTPQDQKITNAAMSFYIVPIFNAASTFGRVLPNALSDKTGPLNLVAPGAVAVGVLILSMLAVKTEAAIIVVAILFGFFSGVFIALPPVAFVALTRRQDQNRHPNRHGLWCDRFWSVVRWSWRWSHLRKQSSAQLDRPVGVWWCDYTRGRMHLLRPKEYGGRGRS